MNSHGTTSGDTGRRVEYLCANTTADTWILVTADSDCAERSYRVYVGKPGTSTREVAVLGVARMRDGGTTHIVTAEGTFFAPSPHNLPLWGRGSDGACVWPTSDTIADIYGLSTSETSRPTEPLEAEEPFYRLDPDQFLGGVTGIDDEPAIIERLETYFSSAGEASDPPNGASH